MELTTSRTTIEADSRRPVGWALHRGDGRRLDPRSVRATCAERGLADAVSFAAGATSETVVVTLDLRTCEELPEPGTYVLTLRSGGGAVEVEVVLAERTCVGFAGGVPEIEYVPPSAATVGLRLFNRCGHSVTVEITIEWGGERRGISGAVTIAPGAPFDVRIPIDADALEDLRDGRLPDDLTIVVRRSTPLGDVEVALDADDVDVSFSVPLPGPRPWYRRRGTLAAAGVAAVIGLVALSPDPDPPEPDVATGQTVAAGDDGTAPTAPTTEEPTVTTRPPVTATTRPPVTATTVAPPTTDAPVTEPTTPRVEVGNYIGLSASEAADALGALGLDFAVDDLAVADLSEDGIVLGQSPAPGELVDPGTTVTLTAGVFDGVLTPDVGGLPADAAVDALSGALQEAGFEPEVAVERSCSETLGGDAVVAQEPLAGTPLLGPVAVVRIEPTCVPVPRVLGDSLLIATGPLDLWAQDGRTYLLDPSCVEGGDIRNGAVVGELSPAAGTPTFELTVVCTVLR